MPYPATHPAPDTAGALFDVLTEHGVRSLSAGKRRELAAELAADGITVAALRRLARVAEHDTRDPVRAAAMLAAILGDRDRRRESFADVGRWLGRRDRRGHDHGEVIRAETMMEMGRWTLADVPEDIRDIVAARLRLKP